MTVRAVSLTPAELASLARPSVDLRSTLPTTIPLQGPRPVCVPFAVSGAHSSLRSKPPDPCEALAAEAIWNVCVNAGKAGSDGTTLAAAGEALALVGQPLEANWPYNPGLGEGTENPPPQAGMPPWFRAGLQPLPLHHDGIEDPIEAALTAGQLPLLVVEITSELEMPDPDGEIEVPPVTAPPGDYHALLVVGAATNSVVQRRRLLIRNSWGHLWGAGGYAWLPMHYLVSFAVQASLVASP